MARKQHQPRYKGIAKINGIRRNMKQMEEIANQLKGERDTMLKHMKDIEVQIDATIKKIKVRINFSSIFGHNNEHLLLLSSGESQD